VNVGSFRALFSLIGLRFPFLIFRVFWQFLFFISSLFFFPQVPLPLTRSISKGTPHRLTLQPFWLCVWKNLSDEPLGCPVRIPFTFPLPPRLLLFSLPIPRPADAFFLKLMVTSFLLLRPGTFDSPGVVYLFRSLQWMSPVPPPFPSCSSSFAPQHCSNCLPVGSSPPSPLLVCALFGIVPAVQKIS